MLKFALWTKLLYTAMRSRSNQQFYDRIADIYDEIFVEHKQHAHKIAQLLTNEFADRESFIRVLDLGCGTGLLSRILVHSGFNVVGVDLSLQSLRILQKRCQNITVLNTDVTSLPVTSRCCDAVVSLGAWRHFHNIEQVMAELVGTLTERGIVIIGYFPPSFAGAVHQGQGHFATLTSTIYQWILGKFGYMDNVSPQLESQTINLAKRYFESVVSVKSGQHWRLIVARNLRKFQESKGCSV